MRTTFLLPMLLALTACAVLWKQVGAKDHPALLPGAQIVTSERGRGARHEWRTDLQADGAEVPAHTVDEVMPYVRPIDTPQAAVAYSDLVRELGVSDAGARGLLVHPDPTLTGRGSGGRYSRSDAAAWGVAFEPKAEPYASGFEVSRVVLFPPAPLPSLPHILSSWRLAHVRELVFKDGTIRSIEEKTLSDGQDAARFSAR